MLDSFAAHSAELRHALQGLDSFHRQVKAVVEVFVSAFASGNKLLIAGNGGSAAEAQHLSDELVGRYRKDRRPYPAIALTADGMVLTCIGNDYGYEQVFRRQVEALGREGDILVCLTTSGTTKNLHFAADEARARGMKVVVFCGQSGTLHDKADLAVAAPSAKAAVVQELHLHAIHLVCEALEPR